MKSKLCYLMPLVMVVMSCSSSRIVNFWKQENVADANLHKIMVLGLIRDADRSLRKDMEDHMVGELRYLGYQAVSSLRELGPKTFDQMDEQAAIGKLQGKGIDAVVTIVLLNRHRERYYVAPRSNYPIGYGGGFWDYRRAMGRVYEPGYFVVNTRYFWESNLYTLEGQHLLFSVQTESFNPHSSQALAHEYAAIIIGNMFEQKVLKRQF